MTILASVAMCSLASAMHAAAQCSTTACLKTVMDEALFTDSWRTPDRTAWLAKREKGYALVTVPKGEKAQDGFVLIDPDLQFRAVNALVNILRRKKLPMFSTAKVKIDDDWGHLRNYTLDTLQMQVLEPELFEFFFTFNRANELDGPIKDYIAGGCFYWSRITFERQLAETKILVKSTLSDSAMEACVEDALYFALGVVDERHPSRDIAIRVLYHPKVRSGMTREELFSLIDNGIIPLPQ